MKKLSKNKKILIICAAIILIMACFVVFVIIKSSSGKIVDGAPPSVSVTAKEPTAGEAGNSGDEAKSRLSTPAPSLNPAASTEPTSSPSAAGIVINSFSVTPLTGGQARASTQIAGAAGGSCQISMTGPGSETSENAGSIIFSGGYYSCDFGLISNISSVGAWQADLTITAGGNAKTAKTNFEVTK